MKVFLIGQTQLFKIIKKKYKTELLLQFRIHSITNWSTLVKQHSITDRQIFSTICETFSVNVLGILN